MKMRILALLACGSLLTVARANTVSDNNPADVWLNVLHPSYSGTFDLVANGYKPGTEVIDSAVATFLFGDLAGGSESFRVTLDDMNLPGSDIPWLGTLTLGGEVIGSALMDLQADGILSYTITRERGEFQLLNANLTAQTHVPDASATAGLVGLGALLLAFVRRKIS
jgi:hypothetical protein